MQESLEKKSNKAEKIIHKGVGCKYIMYDTFSFFI